jgi:RHS repeat-associated protein
MQFSSMPHHNLSGLSLYPFRAYEPNLQRWLNQDPIGEAGGINLYQFVENNPLSLIDPLGLQDEDDRELDARLQVASTGSGMFADLGYGKEEKEQHDQIICEGKQALKKGAKEIGKELAIQAAIMVTTEGLGNLARLAKFAKGAEATEVGVQANRTAGLAAEARAARDLTAEGNIILGSHVAARTSEGLRVIDHLIQTPSGQIVAIEVKSGNAVRSASQLLKDSLMATEGAVLVGKNAPAALQGSRLIIQTSERRY